MEWSSEVLTLLSPELLIAEVKELLRRMGFKEYEEVSNRKEWGVDIIAIREDPLVGSEKIMLKIHDKGMAQARDVNVFGEALREYKADRGILISVRGFTKDARLLVAREYKGRIILWDSGKLISLFKNYGIEVPKDVEIKYEEMKKKREEKKEILKTVELDAPLLLEFSPEKLIKDITSHISKKYPIENIEVEHLALKLRVGYIVFWSTNGTKDRGLVLSKEDIIVKGSENEQWKTPITRAALDSKAVIRVTEKEIEVPVTSNEAIILFKEKASKELGIFENEIKIADKKKVYLPVEARLKIRTGENSGEIQINLLDGTIDVNIPPLPLDTLIEKAKKIVKERTLEEAEEISVKERPGRVKIVGRTKRFTFEVTLNPYTGEIISTETSLTDDALQEILETRYPTGEIFSIERTNKKAIADILLDDKIVIAEVDLTNGQLEEKATLIHPKKAYKVGKEVVEGNFPLSNLKMESFSILEHKYIEVVLKEGDGKAKVKVDGKSGDVLDFFIEISKTKAEEITKQKFPDLKVESIEERESEYIIHGEIGNHKVKVKVSKDGKIIEEVDRVLKEEIIRELATKSIQELDPEAKIKTVQLEDNWIVTFSGPSKVGRIVLHRSDGNIIEKEVRYTEIEIEKIYYDRLKNLYGEEELKTEWLTHHKDKGIVTLKVLGKEKVYYAKIDVKTGKIISEDTAPIKGFMAKIKQIQLEGKYK
ncbi:restriction endonuclease [Thermococcus chitonophagus]|uniref:Restriction endonuclease n=1 Tax=Thermococcus chitonophagus TaxID=54262 RepID=A0A160VS53_9EURY|nr:restriction endonuclease [Thermococcus chitonophagus]ASJ17212.1 restriction endonuclease [Thermococcus chitonophagus]CUX77827.1 predicted type II restriction endonuclease [Thermococcus chitonophagus]